MTRGVFFLLTFNSGCLAGLFRMGQLKGLKSMDITCKTMSPSLLLSLTHEQQILARYHSTAQWPKSALESYVLAFLLYDLPCDQSCNDFD